MVKSVPSCHKQSQYWWKEVPLSVKSNYSWAAGTLYLTCANPHLSGISFFFHLLCIFITITIQLLILGTLGNSLYLPEILNKQAHYENDCHLHQVGICPFSPLTAMLTTVHVWRVVCFIQSNLGQRRRKILKVLIVYILVIQSPKYFHSKIKMVLNVY